MASYSSDVLKLPTLPQEELVDRGVYFVHARQFVLGVYSTETGAFTGIRTKFGKRFLDEEGYWGAQRGSARPKVKLALELPVEINASRHVRGIWECSECRKDLDATPSPEELPHAPTGDVHITGHRDGTPPCADARPRTRSNKDLFAWLDEHLVKLGITQDPDE